MALVEVVVMAMVMMVTALLAVWMMVTVQRGC